MKKRLHSLFFLLFSLSAHAQKPSGTIPRPKIIVGIVVDQMRWDYLYRYYDRYGKGGFKRLLNGGFSFEQTMVNYLPTYTGPGHACIWTGSVPAIHGIAGNEWIETASGKPVYCVSDSFAKSVGGSLKAGRMSPRNLLTTTVGDELKLATNGRSRAFAISLKDRASILPGGRMADGVYWYDDSTGAFITSDWYRNNLPQWVEDFNARHLPDAYLKKGWTLARNPKTYRHSTKDSTRYEGLFKGEKTPTFPHNSFAPNDYGSLRALPAGNTLTLELAKTLLRAENVGKGSDPDLLAINLASTDYAGHQFGPNALELEDVYIRLDEEISRFLSFLDARYGKGNVLLFLTADHGGAHNPQFLKDRKGAAGAFTETGIGTNLRRFVDSTFAVNPPGTPEAEKRSLLRGFDNYFVYLNQPLIRRRGLNRNTVISRIRRHLMGIPGIADVVRMDDGSVQDLPEPIRTRILNGYHKKRSGDLLILPEPGWFAGYGMTGTSHGTWNPYDAHIPLLFYGWNIPHGATNEPCNMTDIAATICALLRIQMPNGCVGKVLDFED